MGTIKPKAGRKPGHKHSQAAKDAMSKAKTGRHRAGNGGKWLDNNPNVIDPNAPTSDKTELQRRYSKVVREKYPELLKQMTPEGRERIKNT